MIYMMEYTLEDDNTLCQLSQNILTLVEKFEKNRVNAVSLRTTLLVHDSMMTQLCVSIEKQNKVIDERSNVMIQQNCELIDMNIKLHECAKIVKESIKSDDMEYQKLNNRVERRVIKWLKKHVISQNEKNKVYFELSGVKNALIEVQRKINCTIEEVSDENNCQKYIIYYKEKSYMEHKNIEGTINTLANEAADLTSKLQILECDTYGPTLSLFNRK